MKLLFKQRLFSWFDSYDIYDEEGNVFFYVNGVLSFGHCLEIYDKNDFHVGTVKEEVFTFLPRFNLYEKDDYIGQIKKEFTFFCPSFTLEYKNWKIDGDFFEFDYSVTNGSETIMTASKQVFNFTDTYLLNIEREENALLCLMIVLAIDAAKCSKN